MKHQSARLRVVSCVGIFIAVVALIALASAPRFSLAEGTSSAEQAQSATSAQGESAQKASTEGALQQIPFDGTAQKQEVIYAKLSSAGSPSSMYAVNTFQSKEGESISGKTIKDYGAYTKVVNLTDGTALKQESDGTVFTTQETSFSYQGTLASTELPWTISFEYYLDGVRVDPTDLAGKSGNLKLVMTTKKNDAVDSTYFDNYLIQATISLPMDKAKNVATEDGSLAQSGSNTSVSFMVLPGKEGNCSLSAQVENFEMDSISIAAVPLAMNIGSINSGSMISNFDQLIEGTKTIAEGSKTLEEGTASLASGANELDSGIQQLNEQAQKLSSGIAQYSAGVTQANEGISSIVEAMEGQSGSMMEFYGVLMYMTPEQKSALETQMGLTAGSLDKLQTSLGTTMYLTEKLGEAEEGLDTLSQSGQELSAGAEQYAQGMEMLASSSGSLTAGASELSQGVASLSEGTSELSTQTQKIPDKLQAEIDSMLSDFDKSDYKPVSFTSSKNTNATLVQFVMTTEAIKTVQAEKEVTEEKELSIIDRFFALFS